MKRGKGEAMGIMLRMIAVRPMDALELADALGICVRNVRKYLVDAKKAKRIHVARWFRPEGAYGHKRAIWAIGNKPDAPYIKDDPKTRLERKERHEAARVAPSSIPVELAQVMRAWS